jgi:hypothetical protein
MHLIQSIVSKDPAIISQMPDKFDSHQFILPLTQENQQPYIEALYHYRDSSEPEAPFMVVHGILARPVRYLLSNRARHLNEYPELIKYIDTGQSKNTFGQVNACAEWEKIRMQISY